MARLVDIDALRKDFKVAERCEDCQQRHCNADVVFSRRDVCGILDDAPVIDAEPAMQWISVKDRLPEPKINPLTQDFAWVICYCDFGGEPKRTDVRFYGFGKPSWAEKAHFMHGGQVMDGVVTHWMPLPEPPKEENDDD